MRQAIAALEELGAEVVEVSVPMMEYFGAVRAAAMADGIVTHEPYIQTNRDDYSGDVLYRMLAGQFVLGRDYSKAMKVQRLIKEDFARVLQGVDCLATPTTPILAPPIGAATISLGGTEHPVKGPGSGLIARNTSPSNATGCLPSQYPAASAGRGFP